jgi:hypothetical protein
MQDLPYLKATTSNVILTHLAFVNIIGNFSAGVKQRFPCKNKAVQLGLQHTLQAISIYVFPEKELRGLCSPNFHMHTMGKGLEEFCMLSCTPWKRSGGIHYNGNSVYIFLFWELRDLNPYFHIHVSERYIYSHDRSTNLPAAE